MKRKHTKGGRGGCDCLVTERLSLLVLADVHDAMVMNGGAKNGEKKDKKKRDVRKATARVFGEKKKHPLSPSPSDERRYARSNYTSNVMCISERKKQLRDRTDNRAPPRKPATMHDTRHAAARLCHF